MERLGVNGEAIGTPPSLPRHHRYLESADANSFSGSAGTGVRASECPMVNGVVALNENVVHHHFQIWEGGHEALSDLA
jgi:hypothetical protein